MSLTLWGSNRNWKKKISAFFKRLFIYLFSYKSKRDPTIDLAHEKRIIIRTYDAYGDAIITTPFLRELKKHFPNLQIDLIVSKKNYDFFQGNIYVDKLYIFSPSLTLKEYWMILTKIRGNYNVLIDLWGKISISKIIAIRLIGAKQVFGVSTESSYRHKYYIGTENLRCYDQVFGLDTKSHHRDRFLDFFNLLGIKITDKSYDIFYPKAYEQAMVEFLTPYKQYDFIIGFNYNGSREDNTMPIDFVIETIRSLSKTYPNFLIILFFDARHQNEASFIESQIAKENVIMQPQTKKFLEFCALVQQCDLLITTTTSTMHIASAFNKYIITAYPDTQDYNCFHPFSNLPTKILYISNLQDLDASHTAAINSTTKDFYFDYKSD